MAAEMPNLLALIALLADDHPEVIEAARVKLVETGQGAVTALKKAAQRHEDPKVRVEAQGVLERIRLKTVSHAWKRAATLPEGRMDLERGAFLLAQVRYSDLDPKPYQQRLDELADRIRPKLKTVMKPQERLELINRLLFREEGFRANWEDYFDPQNSYLNRVLDRKMGIPVTLSLLYLLVGRRLKIPVFGVGIPGHFMVKYQDAQTELYVDPFNEGHFLTRAQCIQCIVESGYPYQREFLDGLFAREILARMLRNLILIYVDRHEPTLERTLTHLLDLLYPRLTDAFQSAPSEPPKDAGGG